MQEAPTDSLPATGPLSTESMVVSIPEMLTLVLLVLGGTPATGQPGGVTAAAGTAGRGAARASRSEEPGCRRSDYLARRKHSRLKISKRSGQASRLVNFLHVHKAVSPSASFLQVPLASKALEIGAVLEGGTFGESFVRRDIICQSSRCRLGQLILKCAQAEVFCEGTRSCKQKALFGA